MSLKGGRELKARLRAIADAPSGIARSWGEDTARRIQSRVPVRTGETRRSVQVRTAGDRAEVTGSAILQILEAGTRAYTVRPKQGRAIRFQARGMTVFSRKADKPRVPGRRIIGESAREALDKVDLAGRVIDRWNGAA